MIKKAHTSCRLMVLFVTFLMVILTYTYPHSVYSASQTDTQNPSTCYLTWGELSPINTPSNGAQTLSLPIFLENSPQQGYCGMILWLDLYGITQINNITWGTDTQSFTHTWQIAQIPQGIRLCILLDDICNHPFESGDFLCQLFMAIDPLFDQISVFFRGCEAVYQDDAGVLITQNPTLPPSLSITLDKEVPQETTAVTAVTSQAEATPSLPEPIPTPTATPYTFVGVQDNINQAQSRQTNTYAVRFLFVFDPAKAHDLPWGNVVCVKGSGVLNLSCDIRDFVLSTQNKKQVSLTPDNQNFVFLTYTSIGLSRQETYVFQVYDSQGMTKVTYIDGYIQK